MRTKVAQGLLTGGDPNRLDSLWFAYSQQSYWQLFNADLSRPFRATDHEPELTYIFPVEVRLALGLAPALRRREPEPPEQRPEPAALAQLEPRDRPRGGWSWGDKVAINASLWQRLPEDAASDDNPDIEDLVGRAEIAAAWQVNSGAIRCRHSRCAIPLKPKAMAPSAWAGCARLAHLPAATATAAACVFTPSCSVGLGIR